MIGQNFGLRYLIPLALERLKENILAGGDFYPGDLLVAVVSIKNEFWEEHSTYKKEVDALISDNSSIISDSKLKLGKYFRR